MKLIVYILTCYFIGLNFVPCSDVFYEQPSHQITQISTDHCDTQQNDECSPVCQCCCCHVHVVQIKPTSVEKAITGNSSETSFYRSARGWDYPKSLLDPPRV